MDVFGRLRTNYNHVRASKKLFVDRVSISRLYEDSLHGQTSPETLLKHLLLLFKGHTEDFPAVRRNHMFSKGNR